VRKLIIIIIIIIIIINYKWVVTRWQWLFYMYTKYEDRLCGLVVRVSGYRYRGPGFDPRRYQIF